MQNLRALASVLALTVAISTAHAADTFGARLLRLHYTNPDQVKRLAELGADICAHGHGFVEVMVPTTSELERSQPDLARAVRGLRTEVISEDPGHRARSLAATPDLGLYHTLAEVKAELDATVAAYPGIAKLVVIGKTGEGRDIWALRIGSDPQDGKLPTFLFTGLHHAREWISIEPPLGLIKKMTAGYATDPAVKAIVDTRTTWVVPVVNPDGLNHSQTQYQMWRKNRRKNEDQSFGVDPNRNYTYMWGGAGASASPASDTYRGPSAGSEPEVKAISELARAKRPVAAISFHSYSELVLWPWGYTEQQPPDAGPIIQHGQAMAGFNGYTPQQSIELYPTTGDFDDYMYGELNVLAYTIELGREFIPPESEIADIVEKNVKCCWYLLTKATNPFPLVSHSALTTQTNPSGPYSVEANLRLAGHPGFVAKSIEARFKFNGGAEQVAALAPSTGDATNWTGTLPGSGYGSFSYYLTATGQDGSVHRVPAEGTYDFKVVEKLILVVADDGGKYASYYTSALTANGLDYSVWSTKSGPVPSATLMQATACVWFTGADYSNTLTAEDQALLGSYLDKGGRLLLFGQDIGYETKETPFYKQRLSARFVKDASGIDQVVGAAFLSGLSGSIGGSADSVKQTYPDVMEVTAAQPTAKALMTYGAGGPVAALCVAAGNSRLAYFGFGLEGIAGEANRAAIMARAFAWLSGSVQVALARSEAAARTGASATGPVASEAMDEALAEQLAADVAAGKLDGVRTLARELAQSAGPAQRVARMVLRRLPVDGGASAAAARRMLMESPAR